MKKFYLLLAICLMSVVAIQGQKDLKAEKELSKMRSSIQAEKNSERQLSSSINFFHRRRGTTTRDLIEIARLMPNDRSKFKLSARVYPNIVDKQNFFNVFNIFERFSFAIKLYHETIAKERVIIVDEEVDPHSHIDFPDARRYRGRNGINCRRPMSDRNFDSYITNLRLPYDEKERLRFIKQEVLRTCFSTAQVMKLGLELDLERDKLSFLKFASNRVYDLGHFDAAAQILNHSYYKEELLRFINRDVEQIEEIEIIEEVCVVDADEFRFVQQSLDAESFRDNKRKLAQKLISKHCFDMPQLRIIFNKFNFEDDRLKLMIFAYDYAPEPRKMYQFRNLLKFRSNQQKYDRFLIDKQ